MDIVSIEAPAIPAREVAIRGRPKPSRIPLPAEHGAWVILYVPLLIGIVVSHAMPPTRALALVVAVTAAHLARHAVGLVLRKRGNAAVRRWLVLYAGVGLAFGIPVAIAFRPAALALLAGILAALLIVYSALLVIPSRRRLDRSLAGEILGVGALCLTAPAAMAASGAPLGGAALRLWVLCFLYFAGGIFCVKMVMAAAKHRGSLTRRDRLSVGRAHLLFHALLPLGVFAACAGLPRWSSLLVAAAFAPAFVRAVVVWLRLSSTPPVMKRAGYREAALAVWFTVAMVVGMVVAR